MEQKFECAVIKESLSEQKIFISLRKKIDS